MHHYKEILFRFILPVLAFLFATVINWRLNLHSDGVFYSLFLMAILISSYFSGVKMALVLCFITIIKIIYFDLEPLESFSLMDTSEIIRLLLFTLGALFVIVVIHRLKMLLKRNSYLLFMAEKASQSKQELLAVVSHDLRNPLGAIMMNAQLIQRKLGAEIDPHIINKCESIARTCESMNVLIDDLLTSAKLEAGSLHLNLTTFRVDELLLKVQDMMGPVALKNNVTFKVTNNAPISMKADFEKILRVLSNLIGNGIKFTPEGGSVELMVKNSMSSICFSIKDTGPGISKEDLPRIFERYWQSGLKASKGAGLGLSISQSIVEAHNGRIWVESQVGEGSCFQFNLPR